ncbi:MAG: hypothetical protein J2P30_23050, partial [Actinobacteria bacterium]|nr:hypothetical protein [Actinomycetota bacterium]
MAHGQRQAAPELTIGVVGSPDLVEQIMLSGTAMSGTAMSGAAMSGAAMSGAAMSGAAMSGAAMFGAGSNGQGAGSYSTAAPATRRLVAVVYRNEQEAGDKVLR